MRYRIDGALHDVLDLPVAMGPAVSSRIKILANMNIVERRRAQDGQISMEIDGRSVDIRVATTGVIEGEKVVLRLLDKSRSLYRLDQLGMPDDMIAHYAGLLRAPYGMVICAGPTGSGKTTTLYGSLGAINSPERNVMTIEDPVEYRIQSINQIQINEQAGITFAGGLRSILRLDPDVILVGEIRDAETARIAVQSALTGHFVLSSLHATDAPSALHRLLDMGIESFLVASSVTAVLAQRLVRRICTHCRAPYEPSREELAFLSSIRGRPPDGRLSARVRLQLLRPDRLPRAHRGVRAHARDRRDPGPGGGSSNARGDAQGGPFGGDAHTRRGGGAAGRVRRDHIGRGHPVDLCGGGLRWRSSSTWRPDPTGGAPAGSNARRLGTPPNTRCTNEISVASGSPRSAASCRPRSADRGSSGTRSCTCPVS